MIEFNKVDAALFAIEGFISRLITHNDNQDHADYYLSMVRNLRGSLPQSRFKKGPQGKKLVTVIPRTDELLVNPSLKRNVLKLDSHLADMEDRARKLPMKKKRAGDKGQMSKKQREAISWKMKKYWVKRRMAERKVGR